MATQKDAVTLPTLSREEVTGCIQRSASCLDPEKRTRLGAGFMSELSLANWLEDEQIAGAYQSCMMQQSRGKARTGPDLLCIDAKHTDCTTLEIVFSKDFGLQVSKSNLGPSGAKVFAFIAAVDGVYHLVGWATKEQVIKDGTDMGQYIKLGVSKLSFPVDMLHYLGN